MNQNKEKIEFNFDILHIFFNAIRKSGMDMSISIEDRGVVYSFSDEKPFNQENWNHALKGLIDEKIITEEQSNVFNDLIETLNKR